MLMRYRLGGALLAALVLLPICGCGVIPDDQDRKGITLGRSGADPEQVQSELMSYTDTFISAIVQQWNQADASGFAAPQAAPPTPGGTPVKSANDRGRRASLEIKISNVNGALAIATSPNPIVSVADMITMVTLQRMILQDPWAPETLGSEKARRMIVTYEEQEAAAWRIAEHVYTPQQQKDLRVLIAQWREDHPNQRYIAGIRLEDFARERGSIDLKDQSSPGSLLALVGLDPLSNLDPTVREVQRSRLLAERMFFYAQHAPVIVKWQTESLYTGLLQTPEVKQTMTAMEQVSDAANNVADAADQLRKDLSKERHEALDDLFTQFRKERQEALDQFFKNVAQERAQTIGDIDKAQDKLGGTLTQVREAAEATEKLTTSLRSTITAADALMARFTPPPGSTPPAETGPKKDVLAEYREAAAQTAQTVEKLTQLADRVDKLLASPDLDARAGKLRTVVDSLQGGVQQTVDRAFYWIVGVAIIGAFCLGAAIAFGLSWHKAMERRGAAKRRAHRKLV